VFFKLTKKTFYVFELLYMFSQATTLVYDPAARRFKVFKAVFFNIFVEWNRLKRLDCLQNLTQ